MNRLGDRGGVAGVGALKQSNERSALKPAAPLHFGSGQKKRGQSWKAINRTMSVTNLSFLNYGIQGRNSFT